MADNSYLYGSTTPASMTSTLSDSSSALPAWLQEMTRGLSSKATEVAGGEFQPYIPPTNAGTYGEAAGRTAAFDPMQTQAFANTQANQGNYQPAMFGQADILNRANAGAATSTPWSPQVDQALGKVNAAYGTAGTSLPWAPKLNQAMGNVGSAYGASDTGSAWDPNLSSAIGQTQAASQWSAPTQQQFMNPYITNVVGEMTRLSNQNLTEGILPQVNSTFAGAGQFGSTRNADFTNRAIRDQQQQLTGNIGNTLAQAQNQAASQYSDWAGKQMQGAAQQGSLGAQGYGMDQQAWANKLQSSQQLAAMAGQGQGMSQQDWANQLQASQQQGALAGIGQGMGQQDWANLSQLAPQFGQHGELTQRLGAQDAGLLSAAGQQRQAQTQANLDIANQDWNKQNDWQKQNIDWLSQIVRGLPASETKYQYTSGAPTSSASLSPLAAAAQGFFGGRTLASTTQK